VGADATEAEGVTTLQPTVESLPALAQANAMTVPATTGDPVTDMMFALVRDRDFSVEKLAALNEIREKMEDRRDEVEFHEQMALCQAEIGPVVTDAFNKQTNSRYAKLPAIDAVIRPVYTRYGFNVRHESETLANGNIRIFCVASRRRHSERVYLDAPADTTGPQGKAVKTVLHGTGSTTTYLRNKTLCMMFNLVLKDAKDDDDGNGGGAAHLDEEQVDEMRGAFLAAKLAEADKIERFLHTHTSYQANDVDEVEARDFPRLMNLLTIMARQKGKGE
jgi:hypothetical protein